MVWPWIWGLVRWVDSVVVQGPVIMVVSVSFGLAVDLEFALTKFHVWDNKKLKILSDDKLSDVRQTDFGYGVGVF